MRQRGAGYASFIAPINSTSADFSPGHDRSKTSASILHYLAYQMHYYDLNDLDDRRGRPSQSSLPRDRHAGHLNLRSDYNHDLLLGARRVLCEKLSKPLSKARQIFGHPYAPQGNHAIDCQSALHPTTYQEMRKRSSCPVHSQVSVMSKGALRRKESLVILITLPFF